MTTSFTLRRTLAGALTAGLIAGGALVGTGTAHAAAGDQPDFFVFNGDGETISQIKAQEIAGKVFQKSDQLVISASKTDPLAAVKPEVAAGVTKAFRFVAPEGKAASRADWTASFAETVDPAAGLTTDNFTLEDRTGGAALSAGKYEVGIAFAAGDNTLVGEPLFRTLDVAADGSYTIVGAGDDELTPVISAKPSITAAKVAVGQKLTAKTSGWGPVGVKLAFQWLSNSTAIPGATAGSYTLKAADAGKRISVRVTGSLSGAEPKSETSNQTVSVAKGALAAPKPKVAGTYKVKKTLKAKAGAWGPKGVKLKYQWLRNGKKIKGATKTSYKLSRADRGKKVGVRVTGSLSGYTTTSTNSTAKKVK